MEKQISIHEFDIEPLEQRIEFGLCGGSTSDESGGCNGGGCGLDHMDKGCVEK